MNPGNFTSLLRERALAFPEAPALIAPNDGGRRPVRDWNVITFGDLDRRADAFAHGFSLRGAKKGDRALFLVKPSVDCYAALFGLLRLGVVPVLIDPGMGVRGVLRCVEQIRPASVVALPVVHAIRTLRPGPFHSATLHVTAGSRWFWGGVRLEDCEVPPDTALEPAPVSPQDDALIAFTSGSTGPAKGVSFTSAMIRRQTELLQEQYDWRPGGRIVMCFAAFVLFTVSCGVTTIIPAMNLSKPAAARPERIVEAANEHRADFVFGSPILWMNLVRHPQRETLRFETVRQVTTTGAPISLDLHEKFRKHLPDHASLHTPYGATEALPLTTIDSEEVLRDTARATRAGKGTCVGRPFPGVGIEVIRVTDDPIPSWSDDLRVAPGEIGEVVASGTVVSPSYKENEAADATAKIRRGDTVLHRMGDLGFLDGEGRLWFCGRKAHRLQTPTGVVPPVPVENLFNQHPSVFRSALVGVGPVGRQAPVLCVELHAPARLTAELEQELAGLAAGTGWEGLVQGFLQHAGFPVDPRHNTKIDREALRTWATGQWRPSAQGQEAA
jgi:acyl-CoA synthetase (AMP-forming)/AMP-acid ligase II